jgi:hypothetical protein
VRLRAPSLLALLVVAAGLEVSTPVFPAHVVPATALAVGLLLCARLDEAGAVAVAAVLVRKGMDPSLALALLVAGPFTRRALMKLRTWLLPAAALVALAAGRVLSGVLAQAQPAAAHALAAVRDSTAAQAAASPLGAASTAVLIAIALATLWTAGVRGWFAPLRHGPRAA